MSGLERRLLTCFRAVFPHLEEAEAAAASQESIEAWDSVAMVTLATLIEEEFGLVVNAEDVAQLSSFALAARYLADRLDRG